MRHLLLSISVLVVLIAASSITALAQQEAVEEKRTEAKKSPFENRPILSIEFRGNTNFTSDKLRELMKDQKVGGAYSTEKLQRELDALRVFYEEDGYLQVCFQDPEIEDTPDGIKINIPVTEGRRYRIGEIKNADTGLILSNEVSQLLDLKQGEIAKYSDIRRKLVRLCNGQGYPQCIVGFTPIFHDNSDETSDGTVDLIVRLKEAEMFYIGKIEFTGNTKIDSAVLLANLLFHEGEVFKSTLIYSSVKRLFDLGLFTDVAAEAHYHTRAKMNMADIVIRLREKQ